MDTLAYIDWYTSDPVFLLIWYFNVVILFNTAYCFHQMKQGRKLFNAA